MKIVQNKINMITTFYLTKLLFLKNVIYDLVCKHLDHNIYHHSIQIISLNLSQQFCINEQQSKDQYLKSVIQIYLLFRT
jgi:hypothetical protein